MRPKPFQRCCDYCQFLRIKIVWILLFFIFIFAWNHTSIQICEKHSSFQPPVYQPLDVVYTWVNGSDPVFVQSIQKYEPNYDPARFDDKNELKYSLRSLEKYAPWIRHVYIVTNGQIPHWLDLTNPRVTVIPHSQIVPNSNILPTFSSSSIETFIHRIPNLSKRFLYLNDDIFLGAALYPEDLYTFAEGVKVYTAWTVPDCAPDCSWAYIGDGACDEHCNIDACQFDGGDCSIEESYYTHLPSVETLFYDVPKAVEKNSTKKENHTRRIKNLFQKKSRFFNELIKIQNTSNKQNLRKLVDSFNHKQTYLYKSQRSDKNYESPSVSSKDIYAQSLVHTNKLFNQIYGFRSRKVLAHVGFFLDRNILTEMIEKFKNEIQVTASHRFRHASDMQFAFAYYHFLMSETYNKSVSDIFDEFDTDKSSTWSDREIRTLLTRLYQLPLDWVVVRYFEDIITNCSKQIVPNEENEIHYTTLVYERYEDSNLPKVSKRIVMQCPLLVEALKSNFAQKSKYKFHINQKTGMFSNFKMLTSNITEVVSSLDELRRNPKKFNCINDNLEPLSDENQLIKYLLEDFYLSFFPQQSKFELSDHFRNRFTYIEGYETWKNEKRVILLVVYAFSAIFLIIGFKYCFKAKYARKLIPYKCDI